MKAFWRLIIHATDSAEAEQLVTHFTTIIDPKAVMQGSLAPYEDAEHFVVVLDTEISGDTLADLEYQAYKLCSGFKKGPWFFERLPKNNSIADFKFEAIYNVNAFIDHDPTYRNSIKWAYLKVNAHL